MNYAYCLVSGVLVDVSVRTDMLVLKTGFIALRGVLYNVAIRKKVPAVKVEIDVRKICTQLGIRTWEGSR